MHQKKPRVYSTWDIWFWILWTIQRARCKNGVNPALLEFKHHKKRKNTLSPQPLLDYREKLMTQPITISNVRNTLGYESWFLLLDRENQWQVILAALWIITCSAVNKDLWILIWQWNYRVIANKCTSNDNNFCMYVFLFLQVWITEILLDNHKLKMARGLGRKT